MMERTVLMIRPEQRTEMARLAERQHVSLAEINRRAIDQYINMPANGFDELNLLADVLIKSNAETKKALVQAELAVDKTLKAIAAQKSKRK